MRKNNLTIDALLTFKQVKEISEKELLELYRSSLETCQLLDQQAGTNIVNMNFEFKVKTEETRGSFIEITEMKKSQGDLKIHIYLSKQAENFERIDRGFKVNESNYQIFSVQKIYDCFSDQSLDELNEFRNLLGVIRIWRRENGFLRIMPEVFDAVLSHVLLANRTSSPSEKLIKMFNILSSENRIEAVLQQFDPYYLSLFKSYENELKGKLSKESQETMQKIVQNQFSEVYLFQFLRPLN